MTRQFIAVTIEVTAAWANAIERRGIDPATRTSATSAELVDAAELGIRLFRHICAHCHCGWLVVDERASHPGFPKFMRGLDTAMRTWHKAAVNLAAVVTRDVDGSMTVPETRAFVSKAIAVGRAIAKADRRGLQFDDFESEFKALEDPSDEGEL